MLKPANIINANIDITEVYDDVACITISGDAKETNISITGDSATVSRCVAQLGWLVETQLSTKVKTVQQNNAGRC